jgi:superfamily I DNA/RNA helicase
VKECNEKSGGAVIHRLENIYNYIYIDEVQDLSGYDLDLIELLFRSKIM